MKKLILLLFCAVVMTSCMENYSVGDRVGMLTQFSETGWVFKTYEGQLNLTQTGMNSSGAAPFDFSLDRDNHTQEMIDTLNAAMHGGWKIKIKYHQVKGWNWFDNRGSTDYFITSIEVLDKKPVGFINNSNN